MGTSQYMSPEQARGDHLGPPADVLGIGAVLFEAATGKIPFGDSTGGRTEGKRYEQLERRAEPVRAHRRVAREFAEAMDGCLEPDPARRPTVDALAKRLRNVIR